MQTPIKLLDLFAGGGGFSAGFLKSSYGDLKYELIRALELDEDACNTLKSRYGSNKVIQGDITKQEVKDRVLKEAKDVDIIIGGPPCQTFSLAGPARSGSKEMRERLKNDPRNTLYKHFLEIVDAIKPPFVVFENVEGMVSKKVDTDLSQKHQQVIELICDELESLGYHTNIESNLVERYQVLNAVNYGTPQFRKRIIIIANRFNVNNPVPEKSHLKKYENIRSAIGHLPVRLPKINTSRMNSLKNIDILKKYYEESLSAFMDQILSLTQNRGFDAEQQGLTELYNELNEFYQKIRYKRTYKLKGINDFIVKYNSLIEVLGINNYGETNINISHQSREHNFRDIVIFSLMKQGSNSARFMNPQYKDYTEILDKLYPYARNKHKDTYVKHSWDKPSNTILAHMEKDGLKFIHPEQPRTFTPYEAALLQSFPKDYSFSGNRNAQYRQIGNAVPPKMAEAIGTAILKVIQENSIITEKNKTYELV
ncbi:DNA cytosine methyltransferase [Niallia sp. Krafla_26]|uniref:DNA cytosine methyltransferase n=1 Tax=Niallia sp. Krafla_26 TaxID=3064703 RepID=UPI003D17ABAA